MKSDASINILFTPANNNNVDEFNYIIVFWLSVKMLHFSYRFNRASLRTIYR